MKIKVVVNSWNCQSNSTQKLAEAVYKIFSNFVGASLLNNILVYNDQKQGYPIAHYEMENGSWKITLSCESGTHWSQVAYQLSHELCHLYCNHNLIRHHKYKWFEESLCECASIFILHELGKKWKDFEVAQYNPNYGSSINTYISDVVAIVEEQPTSSKEFTEWLNRKNLQLENSSRIRNLNKVVAVYLYNFLFKLSPYDWRSILTLNSWNCCRDASFNDFIGSWCSASKWNLNEVLAIKKLLLEK